MNRILPAALLCLLSGAVASAMTCQQLVTDTNTGLSGNSAIKELTVQLIAAGAQAPAIPGGGGRGRGPAGASGFSGAGRGAGGRGAFAPSGGFGGGGGRGPAVQHAAWCSVQFTYSSRGDSKDGYAPGQMQHIRIAIGLPLNPQDGGTGKAIGAWNGKLENLGGGGCAGNVGATTSATDEGYVGSSTDTGHTTAENGSGPEQRCDFGVIQDSHQLNKGMINDFIYEGVHQQVEWAKTLAKAYYSAPVQRNYWNGCSTGGRQGLALAEQYGDEFDGFIVGAPAIYWQEFRLADAWPAVVVKDRLTAKNKTLTAPQFAAATQAAIKMCDVHGLDTVQDGLVDDPRSCNFSAKANICGTTGAPGSPNCLDADQAAAIDEIWAGPKNEFGTKIWYPFNPTITLGLGGAFGGFGNIPGSTAQVMSYNHQDLTIPTKLLFVDKAAIRAAGNPPGAMTYAEEAALGSKVVDDLMETRSVDLSKVKNRGAKIIMWQGTSDPAIRWTHSLDYYRRVATFFGKGKADFDALQSWYRYYHAPGVGHCGGGEGPAPVNIFDSLVSWVEDNKAPDSILARGGSLNPQRTRPLCAWPKTAVYNGSGSIDDAANYTCQGDLDADPKAVCRMLHTQFGGEDKKAVDDKAKGIKASACK